MSSAKIALIFKLRMLGLSLPDEGLAMAAAAVAAAEAAASMRHPAAMEAATQAGMPAPCVSVRDAAVVEAAECARMRGREAMGLAVKSWTRVPQVREGRAMRAPRGGVVHHLVVVPVGAPVVPAPGKAAEEADTQAQAEIQARPRAINVRHGNPAGVRDERRAVRSPGVVSGHVDHRGIGGPRHHPVPPGGGPPLRPTAPPSPPPRPPPRGPPPALFFPRAPPLSRAPPPR